MTTRPDAKKASAKSAGRPNKASTETAPEDSVELPEETPRGKVKIEVVYKVLSPAGKKERPPTGPSAAFERLSRK